MQFTVNVDNNFLWGVGAARMAHAASLTDQSGVPSDDTQFLEYFIGQSVQEWCKRALPVVVVAGVPQSVSRRQALQALVIAGKFALVQPAIDKIADPVQKQLMQIEWDDSQTFERQRPALLQMAEAIGLTGADLDNLFRSAAQL